MFLTSTSDVIRVITGSAGAVKAHASWADATGSPVAVTAGRTNTASITSATTTTIVPAPASSTARKVKFLSVRNDDTAQNVIEINHFDGTNSEPVWEGTLLPGEAVCYIDGKGWQYLDVNGSEKASTSRLDRRLRVTSDVVNATTSFADVTGLTCPLQSGKKYAFEAHLYHVNNASTTGSQFGVNIGAAPTALIVGTIDTVTPSVTAAAMSAGVVTALDTAATAQTTGSTSNRLAILSGFIQPSADGTFAIRCKSEVAVAAGLTVKAGSWLWIWEVEN